MSERQRGWNKYEAVILLDGYLAVLNGKMSRSEGVKCVSNDLRKIAKNQGEEIDEVFRNENGISFQMQSMESAYKGYTVSKLATKLFSDVVEIYNTNKAEYKKLLKEARAMINQKPSCETEFMTWLSKKVSPARLSELYWCYSEIEAACLTANILKQPLFQTTDMDTIRAVEQYIEKNKLFRVKHMRQFYKITSAAHCYLTFIKEKTEREKTDNGNFSLPKDKENTDKDAEKTVVETGVSYLTGESMVEENANKDSHQTTDETKSVEPVVRQETQENKIEISKKEELTQKIHDALKADAKRNSYGTTLYFLMQQAETTERKEAEQILAEAEWAKYIYGRYYYVGETLKADLHMEKSNKDEEKETDKSAGGLIVKTSEDARLLAKNPVIYRRVFYALRDSSNPVTGVTVSDVQSITQRIGRAADIEEILDNASWSESLNGKYRFAREESSHDKYEKTGEEKAQIKEINKEKEILTQEEFVVNFNKWNDLGYTKPSSFTYFDENKDAGRTWTELYVSFFSVLYDDYPDRFKLGMSFSKNSGRMEFAKKEKAYHMFSPKDVPGTNYVIETNISATNMIRKMKYMLDLCDVDYENVVIKYRKKSPASEKDDAAVVQQVQDTYATDNAKPMTSLVDMVEPNYHCEPYERILRTRFQHGYRLNSAIELRRFKKCYEEIFGEELADNDQEVASKIRRLCILYQDKAYLPDMMLGEEAKDKLFKYIDTCFSEGKNSIYYQALCTKFAEDFINFPVYNDPEALKAYLSYVGRGRFYINHTYISKNAYSTMDPVMEIRECLKDFGHPVRYDDIFAALPHLPQDKVKSILAQYPEFVNNGRCIYFHESIIPLTREELESIATIIEQTIETKDFISGNELFDAIEAKYPYIIENNAEISVYGFRDTLRYKFSQRFSFNGNIISAAGKSLSMTDVFANYARKHDSFTLTELKALAKELNTSVYLDAVYDNSIRVSHEQFVAKNQVYFDVVSVDAAIDRECMGDYVAICKIKNFAAFPYVGFAWNGFLLEHYVAMYSEKYMLIHARFNQDECVGTIVKRSANINSMDDLIVEILKNMDVELEKKPVLEMLVSEGYLARRKYDDIEGLIFKAKAQRNRKEIN